MSHDWDKGRYVHCSTCKREYDKEHVGHDCPGSTVEQIRRLVQEHGVSVVISLVRQIEVDRLNEQEERERQAKQREIDALHEKVREGDEARRRLEELKK